MDLNDKVILVTGGTGSFGRKFAETVLIELDEDGLHQVDGLLIPVVHLCDTPPASDARALGHAMD